MDGHPLAGSPRGRRTDLIRMTAVQTSARNWDALIWASRFLDGLGGDQVFGHELQHR